ncbi:MAG: hypothetical protein ACR2FQ_03685 [Pseudonocardiaceae bacterium]
MTTALAPATPRVADDGSVRFLAAVTGVPDEVDDLIMPGAFVRTLRTRKPKIVGSHDWRNSSAGSPRPSSCCRATGRLPGTIADGAPWPREAGALPRARTVQHGQPVLR